MTPAIPPAVQAQVRALAAQLASAPTWWEFDNILNELVLARDKMKTPESLFNSKSFVEDEA